MCLLKLMTWKWNSFSVQTRVDIRELRARSSINLHQSLEQNCCFFLFHAVCFYALTRRNAASGNYVLNLLAERGPLLDNNLRQQLLSLLARITKLGWFDGEDPVGFLLKRLWLLIHLYFL